jgi:hypothetical protein
MIDQRRYRSYQASDLFADRRVMRTPPPDTVPRERPRASSAFASGLDDSGHYVAEIPLPLTHALFAKGRTRFGIFCAPCHGVRGDGISSVASNMTLRKPPSLLSDGARSFPPGRIFQVITRGYGLMRPYAGELDIEERWAVVAYMRALELSQNVALDDLPPSLRGEAEEALR